MERDEQIVLGRHECFGECGDALLCLHASVPDTARAERWASRLNSDYEWDVMCPDCCKKVGIRGAELQQEVSAAR